LRELGWLPLGKDRKLFTKITALPKSLPGWLSAKEGFTESLPERLSAKIFFKKK